MKLSGCILSTAADRDDVRLLDALPGFKVVNLGHGLAGVEEAWRPDGAHHLVLKGDSAISPLLPQRAAEAAELFPDAAVSFFAGWNEPNGSAVRLAAAGKHGWVEGIQVDYVSAQAFLLPEAHACEFADFVGRVRLTQPDYDAALLDYLQFADLRLLLSVPSLVNVGGLAAWFADNRPGESVLSGYPYCPYFVKGLSYGMNRYGAEENHTWCHEHWSVAAGRLGLKPTVILDGFDSGQWSAEQSTYVKSLWVTSFLLGALTGADGATLPPALVESLITGGYNGAALGRASFGGRESHLTALTATALSAGAEQWKG